VSIAEYNPFTKTYAQTEDYSNKRIELAGGYLALSALTPGRCLRLDIKAFSNPTTISSSVKFFNPLVRVTCGCPSQFLDELVGTEPSGSPSSFVLLQVRLVALHRHLIIQSYGRVYLQWTDRSLCETGFSFDRGGAQFAPLYSVQDATVCHLKHSPSSIFDDLSTAQSQGQAGIGTTQTYCIRATAEIGCDSNKYESDPTCTDIVIAWESAFSGSVLGRPSTGNAPTKDVTVSWYFVSYPDIGGSATTNADGQFVELTNGALGVNIQVAAWHHLLSLSCSQHQ
jgi:hypothetical protein